ncbi:hypothetical protein [Saccharothrix sp. NRRL B-16314]|uniref:hypothetical protein n=1 Tax=Saccharothrix sp. NRRL B-16314 TaxID=1463825 RepID=UPI000ABD4DAB|nr:hypothetical protein [Saccharothrix sp. NRRL B-16314]
MSRNPRIPIISADVGGVWHWNRYGSSGTVVHEAEWDSGMRTAGRGVAVIGAGSSGTRVVSTLQPEAARTTHFTRTPQWVMSGPLGEKRRPTVKKAEDRDFILGPEAACAAWSPPPARHVRQRCASRAVPDRNNTSPRPGDRQPS